MRAPDLQTFRTAVTDLACEGAPSDVRNRLVVVPTRAAAAHVVSGLERARLPAEGGALVLPDFVTRVELRERLAERLDAPVALLTGAGREVLMGVACRAAAEAGVEPPFRLRAGLVAEIVRFYDALQLNLRSVDTFERLALGMLAPGAANDRGAERLVRQTRFLAGTFREFERLRAGTGHLDEHLLRERLLSGGAARPWRHVVVSVGDRACDPHGLLPADWDLLARLPGLERLDVVTTEAVLAGAFHRRIHEALPGIEEVRAPAGERRGPCLLVASDGEPVHAARDREEEVAAFARWVRTVRQPMERFALVIRRPLPYVYLARQVLTSAGVPSQMFDALPLAAEPFPAALDLVLQFVTGGFNREASIALLRSPHFRFGLDLRRRDVVALDQALAEGGYLGGYASLERTIARWRDADRPRAGAVEAGETLLAAARALGPLTSPAPGGEHLGCLLAFLAGYERLPAADDPLRPRLLRGRAATLDVLATLQEAYGRFDATPVDFDRLVQTIKRWIEAHTFAPYVGEGGVHVVDAHSARFGDFDRVQLAGLVEGEWPESAPRNIFYPAVVLRELGWPADAERLDGVRAEFADLLRLPRAELVASAFTLEDDAIVSASPLVELLFEGGLDSEAHVVRRGRIFDHEALAGDPLHTTHLQRHTAAAARRRAAARALRGERQGRTSGHRLHAYSLSALERYQDCPFRFFAADVLRLEEPIEDEPTLSPRAHGKLVHEIFQRFFAAWDARGAGTITAERLDEARALFEYVSAPLLAALPEADAALERARLFGSAVSPGIADTVLGLEAARPTEVRERWLEYRLEGEFTLGEPGGRRVALKGVADRVDLLAGDRLRVVDYKSGYPPNPKRALQAAVYALCARERLESRDGRPWTVDEASYVALAGKRTLVPVVRAGSAGGASALAAARTRLLAVVDGIEDGSFPARPFELRMCAYCPYPSVCRKDYVVGE